MKFFCCLLISKWVGMITWNRIRSTIIVRFNIYSNILLMFKYSHGDVPVSVSQLFRTNNEYHDHNTRNCARIHAQVGTTEASYRTFGYRGIHIWNHISQKIYTNTSYPCFKKIVKIYIQDNNLDNLRLNYWNIVFAIRAYTFLISYFLYIISIIFDFLFAIYFVILIVKVIEKWKSYTPFSSFLIEALGLTSCKNLNKFLKKCPKYLFFASLATLHIQYVTITPANRCHGKVNYVLNAIFKVCKISKTKRRNTY